MTTHQPNPGDLATWPGENNRDVYLVLNVGHGSRTNTTIAQGQTFLLRLRDLRLVGPYARRKLCKLV